MYFISKQNKVHFELSGCSGGVVLDKLDSYNIMVFRTYFLFFGIL